MPGATLVRHSFLGYELSDCRSVEGLTHRDFALRLIQQNFPSSQYSGYSPPGCADDLQWLTDRLMEVEEADLNYIWPFGADVNEFIGPAAQCFSRIIDPTWRLRTAFARDELARLDLIGP